jgi:hypothetical protein
MSKNILILLMAGLVALVFTACKEDEETARIGEAIINGLISDANTGAPLSGAGIQAQMVGQSTQTKLTDALGSYSFTFSIDSTARVTLSITRSGYRDTSIVVNLGSGTVTPLNIALNPRSQIVTGGGGSGLAQTIAFLGADPQEISVYGVGGQETAILGYEVRDSLGLPIDLAHAVTLTFTALGGPNGGEYISPPTATTNANGRAYTTFNSGIRSGVLQIVASTTVAGRVISSSPVRVIIHAGFPDQAHFTIGANRFNFPALGIVGARNPISVLVGDKYSNPVVTNTAVYFRSSAGVIQASVFTNGDGQGTVDLISGNPSPVFAPYFATAFGPAYHYVVGRTIGETGLPVQDSILILWSGAAMIDSVVEQGTGISADGFDVPNGGFKNFVFKVSDYLGHPLARGTTIRVTAQVPPPPDPFAPVNQIQMAFGVEGTIVLEDFLFAGFGTTLFSFRISDGTPTIDSSNTAVTVSILVTGPNGNAYRSISGTVQ